MEELVIRFLHGRASAEDARMLSDWRRASSANEAHYRELERLWSLVRDAEPLPTRALPSVEAITGRCRPGPTAGAGAAEGHRARRRPWVSWAVAAAAMVVLAFGVWRVQLTEEPNAALSHVAELSTGAGEMATLRLADGSVVRLGPQSRLRFTGTAEAREVWLEGRAFFAVAKQPGVPFRVRSHAGDAVVLGTRFEVRVDQTDLRVLVVEGRVALSAGDERVEVKAGELSHVAAGAEPIVMEVHDMERRLEWLGEFLVFQATPLDQFAREFERHYGVPVHILDEPLTRRTVTGWFTDQPAEDVLMMICYATDVHCSIRDGVAIIEP